MKRALFRSRLAALILFATGVALFFYISSILVERGNYADIHQTSGYTTTSELLFLALSVGSIIFGSAASVFLLGIKEPVHTISQLWQINSKQILRAIGLGILIFIIIFSRSILLLIILYLLMRNKEIAILKQRFNRKRG